MNLTPEQQAELWNWYQGRKVQQLSYPVDDASRAALDVPEGQGAGSSALTDTITIGAGGGSAHVPKALTGTILLKVDGVTYEIGYIRTV